MGRQAREYSESKIYHIMFRGVNYQDLFEEGQDYKKMLDILYRVKSEMKFEVYAYCMMTNHVHLVIKENKYRDISLIMKKILSNYSRWYNIKYKRTGALIANRYKSMPVEIDEYFLCLIRYIHQNPTKAGIVENLSDYKYSSYNEYLSKTLLVDKDFVLEMMNIDDFKEFHLEQETIDFEVTDSSKKTDEKIILHIRKVYGIENPKEISMLDKPQRNSIMMELKSEYPARQLQRITGISRGIISRL